MIVLIEKDERLREFRRYDKELRTALVRHKENSKLRKLLRTTELQLRDYERQCKDSIKWIYGCPKPIETKVELRRAEE